MRLLLSLCLLGMIHLSCQQTPAVTTIAFGSCSQQESVYQMWDEINAEHPEVWIWGGDIIYGDSPVADTLRRKYATQKNRPGYQHLMANSIVTGTWDDHDFGVNDGGKQFISKKESQQEFLDFMDVPENDVRRKQEGVYSSLSIGKRNHEIKIINLDTRYFRDTLIREYYVDTITQQRRYNSIPNPNGDVLGEEQWAWLENELTTSTAAIHIINSSIQVIAEDHPYEKWANFPTAQKRLYELIIKSNANGVIIISGDRHMAEISKIKLEGLPYPLYDFTSSGLTHSWTDGGAEVNRYRVGDLITQLNYGLIQIHWNKESIDLELSIKGKDRIVYQQQKITFPRKN